MIFALISYPAVAMATICQQIGFYKKNLRTVWIKYHTGLGTLLYVCEKLWRFNDIHIIFLQSEKIINMILLC